MSPIRLLIPALATFAIVSCAPQKNDSYDTSNPSGGAANAATSEPANPVYDTPAAYEETSGTVAAMPSTGTVPAAPTRPNVPSPAAPVRSTNGAAIIHTVVAGDTLSGISAKYKVPSAAIKQANAMTKDTVVLGRKMVIPPVR
jgi:LysM repeat protein